LLTTNPTVVVVDAPGTTWVTRVELTDRLPARIVARKSWLCRKRYARASTSCYAESFARPLRRREERMDRPARVRIRRRNPCFLLRRRLFGWKVRLLTGSSPFSVLGPACLFNSARRPPLAHVRSESWACGGCRKFRLHNGTGRYTHGQTDTHTANNLCESTRHAEWMCTTVDFHLNWRWKAC